MFFLKNRESTVIKKWVIYKALKNNDLSKNLMLEIFDSEFFSVANN